MKIRLSFISLFFTLLSCHKEIPVQKEPCIESEAITDSITKVLVYEKKDWPDGYGNAIKINSKTWFKVVGFLYLDRKLLGIKLLCIDSDNNLAEDISISNFLFKPDCYEVVSTNINDRSKVHAEYCSHHADIVIDEYVLDTTAVNMLELFQIDTINKIIEGNFAISFVYSNNRPKRNPFEPDRIRYFNGYFKGVYYE
ncbi:MAG: hypothetical protein IPM48_06805 [Saprospiraceae bacterium]|nr:hypothetical protein [Saprospiraceae bacterium]